MRKSLAKHVFQIMIWVTFLSIPVFGKDLWIKVQSKNFFLLGNADEKDIRMVATKLEQFRATFRLLFPHLKFNQSKQTNVVVFRNSSAYDPYRPKRANGKPDSEIAGYFHSGSDLNYITLSAEFGKEDPFGTIFHEYVHFLLNTNLGSSKIPTWFNEGLAEYYQTFTVVNEQVVTLGYPRVIHLNLLAQNKLIPLRTFFEVDNYSLSKAGNHSRSIFYAQAWALVHYLLQENKEAGKQLELFVTALMSGTDTKAAFESAFSTDYASIESKLKKYVTQANFKYSTIISKNKLVVDTEMTATHISDGEANAYLGDLLYHLREYENADSYLKKAISIDPDSSLANSVFGLVRMREGKFTEAKVFLEKAIASKGANSMTYYRYAFVISRESMDKSNYVSSYSEQAMSQMSNLLKKAIELDPDFSNSYSLLAFIYSVNNKQLDDALRHIRKASDLQPGNQDYVFQMAQIYFRQRNFKDARAIAETLVKTASDPSLRADAEDLINQIPL